MPPLVIWLQVQYNELACCCRQDIPCQEELFRLFPCLFFEGCAKSLPLSAFAAVSPYLITSLCSVSVCQGAREESLHLLRRFYKASMEIKGKKNDDKRYFHFSLLRL